MRRIVLTFLLAAVLFAAAACAQAEGENWICPDCGRVNTTRFCTYCGQARPERIVCPGCGKIYSADPETRFCGDCGTRLREETEPVDQKTDSAGSLIQQTDILPAPPAADLTAAYYEEEKEITLSSYQDYDIYYTFDPDAVLPDEGIQFREPIHLKEGTWNLRAVCVNGGLVSDELRSTYRISMPSPQMPRCSLAPGTYKTRQSVRLEPGKDNTDDQDIVIYYTIDGSSPDMDSPIYKGEPIRLPAGQVTLQAVAVNQYGKTSNPLTVRYKINAEPKPMGVFSGEDIPDDIRPGRTTREEFFGLYGEGTPAVGAGEEETAAQGSRVEYSWGYAVMMQNGGNWVVSEIGWTEEGHFTAPRGTGIGQTEEQVTAAFRDCGQEAGASGSRGLYFNDKGSGKLRRLEDGSGDIRYIYSDDAGTLQLDYYTVNNAVCRISMKCVP